MGRRQRRRGMCARRGLAFGEDGVEPWPDLGAGEGRGAGGALRRFCAQGPLARRVGLVGAGYDFAPRRPRLGRHRLYLRRGFPSRDAVRGLPDAPGRIRVGRGVGPCGAALDLELQNGRAGGAPGDEREALRRPGPPRRRSPPPARPRDPDLGGAEQADDAPRQTHPRGAFAALLAVVLGAAEPVHWLRAAAGRVIVGHQSRDFAPGPAVSQPWGAGEQPGGQSGPRVLRRGGALAKDWRREGLRAGDLGAPAGRRSRPAAVRRPLTWLQPGLDTCLSAMALGE
mmetsp:Transcript_44869/g.130696  ORF Transcript_44869/g.130696 Transcript_44869/m.130696 type:complete len:284 (-) Transcript_44869:108-959(-)